MSIVINSNNSVDSSDNNMDLNPLIRLKETVEGAQKNTSKILMKVLNE